MPRRYVVAGLASLLALGSGPVLAQDNATINVIGEIVASTCSLSVSNATLTIGTQQQSVFTGLGSESPLSNTDIIATAPTCTAAGISMRFTGAADPNDDKLFAVNGGAAGVGIKLEAQTSAGWQQAFPSTSPSAVPITNIIGAQTFRARYVQSASPITNGTANATITVLVTYT